jgi:oxygen-independent coproporphyrinogen III oxidase
MTQVSSLYLHVPFCRHLCNYCDFYKKKFDPQSDQLTNFHLFLNDSMKRHALLMQEHQVSWAPLETLYLGGGTPSLWGEQGARFFADLIRDIPVKAEAEFTMEVDPGTWSAQMIYAWQEQGLNRISIGTQTLDPQFLKIMDRDHSREESFELLRFCQKEGWNFSLDFLLGLPFSQERKRQIKQELDLLLEFEPKHISLYILNARSKYPHVQSLPDDEYIREEYLFVSDYLRSQGFHHYEVSNFALPGYESKHNSKYWKSESVAALGPTGTGYFALKEAQGLRYKWKVSQAEVELENLRQEEIALESTYLQLRTSLGWRPDKMTTKLDLLFTSWKQLGYGDYAAGRVQLNALGFLMLDSLMDDLFRVENS